MTIDDPLTVEEAVALLEFDLGITPGFLTRLADEDDWSFIVKSHAFLEAAISHLLADALSEPTLLSIFARIETSNTRSGKIAFLKKLDLLNEDARRLIHSYSELRNDLVHDVGQVGFTFSAHLKALDKQKTDKFVKAFGYFANGDSFERNGEHISTRQFLLANPKQGLWFSVMAVCAVIYLSKDLAKLRRLTRSLEIQINEADEGDV
jgi:hypothetical protein